jgi:hypothetical protein
MYELRWDRDDRDRGCEGISHPHVIGRAMTKRTETDRFRRTEGK